MKRLFLPVLLSIMASESFSQIKEIKTPQRIIVGTIKNHSQFVAELSYSVSQKDTLYLLIFENEKYRTLDDLKNVSFSGKGNVINIFYSYFIEAFKATAKHQKIFKLGDKNAMILTTFVGGIKDVTFFIIDEGYFRIKDTATLNKLFNKK